MDNQLKPCPFCGSMAHIEDSRTIWVVRCDACSACVLGERAPEPDGTESEEYWARIEQTAIDAWNLRAALPSDAVGAPIWQPIETAPKDGTEVALLFASEAEVLGQTCPRVRAAAWRVDWTIPYRRDNPPTHWSPLPAAPNAAAPVAPAAPVEMSPEFTDSARAALTWVLYHHQGGSSPIGRPIRFALGMGAHEPLNPTQIGDALRLAKESRWAWARELPGAAPTPTGAPAAGAPALTSQQIYDKFSFLEGLVSQNTYINIAETAIEIYGAAAKVAAPMPTVAADAAAPKQIGRDYLTLTGAQLLEALDFIAPDRATDPEQLESAVGIEYGEGHSGTATYVWCAEYPEEGCFVLDGKPASGDAVPIDAKAAQPDESAAFEAIGRQFNDYFGHITPEEACRTINELQSAINARAGAPQAAPSADQILDLIYECNLGGATEQQALDFARQLLSAGPTDRISDAARDVLAERARQVSVEGWTAEHDDKYRDHEMSCAAGCYAMHTLAYPAGDPPPAWPWAADWWKPTTHRRNLIKASALILAEIERIDRAARKAEIERSGQGGEA